MSVQDLDPGTDFAGYRIERVIGRGGMGVVYRARDESLNRPVAIKLLNDASAADPELRQRFEREARLMAALDHPNVIPVYAAGEQDGHLYLVMRYVDGTDLARLLRSQGRLSAEESARIVAQVARALDAAHARGLVHRDIKPANVLLSGDHVYLSDFGITRLVDEHIRSTDSGNWVGTVDYMSPEHLRGEPTDALSDVYALGCLLYTCLTGTPPFHRDSTPATINAQLNERPPKASQTRGVPKRFDTVLAQALAKRPKDRYPSAGRLATAALAAVQGKRPARIREPKPDLAEQPTRIAPPTQLGAAGESVASEGSGQPTGDSAAARLRTPSGQTPSGVAQTPAGDAQRLADGAPSAADAQIPASDTRTLIAGRDTRVDRRVRPGGGAESKRDSNAPTPTKTKRRRLIAALAAGGLAALIIVVILIANSGGGSATPTGPLSSSEITGVVQRFATDYGHRDIRALTAVLAPGVTRVAPTVTQHGRLSVLREYQQQLTSKPLPQSYVLKNLHVQPGWAGRASGDYTLTLAGGGKLSGHVTFGVERVDGRAQIGLIATA